jgi:hypothetical protein
MLRVVLGRARSSIEERCRLSDLQFNSPAAAGRHSERSRAVTSTIFTVSGSHHKEADSDAKDASTGSLDGLGGEEELEKKVW